MGRGGRGGRKVLLEPTPLTRSINLPPMADKRKAEEWQEPTSSISSYSNGSHPQVQALAKRARVDDDEPSSNTSLISISSADGGKDKSLVRSINRTSKLSSPILNLTGAHGAELLDVQFSPDGQYIAAASADKHICESLKVL